MADFSKAILIPIILALLSGSCSGIAEKRDASESPAEIVDKALGSGHVSPAKMSTFPVADRSDLPYVPVVTPPEVMRVWIYDHVTPSNDLVMGHWVYIKITDQDWYIKSNLRKSILDKLPLPPKSHEPQQQQAQGIPNTPAPKEPSPWESLLNATRSK